MLLNSTPAVRSSAYESLTKMEQAELDTYIIGLMVGSSVYSDEFTVPDIVGGRFTQWKHTPLHRIYIYHKKRKDCTNPVIEAGKDMGRIFKYVMAKDKVRTYEQLGTYQRQYPVNRYRVVL